MKIKGLLVLLFVILFPASTALAQNVNLQWNRWDAQITVTGDNSPLSISEYQEIQVSSGTVHSGTRYWTTQVDVQRVTVQAPRSNNTQQLNPGNGNDAGTYNVSQSGGQTSLRYTLPTAAQAGDTFAIQIDYRATSPTTGMVDWKIVPADHQFPVQSSTVRIRFPSGQAPDASLIRASQGSGNVQQQGGDYVITSNGSIPAGQAFAIQAPFGANVGAAGANNGNNGNNGSSNGGLFGGNTGGIQPAQPGTDQGSFIQLPGAGTVCAIACIVGVLLLLGGGGLFRGLLGGFLPGMGGGGLLGGLLGGRRSNSGGGMFGNGGGFNNNPGPTDNSGGGSFFGNSGGGRGFRQSGDQNRNVGNVGNDKDSGGGASFN